MPENLRRGTPDIYTHSPQYRASLQREDIRAETSEPIPISATASHNTGFHKLLTHQSVALLEVSAGAQEAARYLVAVASGRKKGEQWRMTAARDVLDRVAATGATVSAAQQAQASAARADADLAPLLAKLLEARALAARKAGAVDVDATQQSPETGRISGTQAGD